MPGSDFGKLENSPLPAVEPRAGLRASAPDGAALSIRHETIYRHIRHDKREGGTLHTHLRGACMWRRKHYGTYDSRGRFAGKRLVS